MAEDNADKSKKSFWIIVSCAGVVVVGIALALFQANKSGPVEKTAGRAIKIVETPVPSKTPALKQPPSAPSPKESSIAEETAPAEKVDQPVVDYGKLKKDKAFQALMDKRKEEYGFERGVDLIVKPEESIKVGDEVIPMQEILEKIRLKRGDVIEKDIAETTESGTSRPKTTESGIADQKRFEEIEKLLKASGKPGADPEQTKEKKIEQAVTAYRAYKATEEKIKEKKKLLKDLEEKKEFLVSQQRSATAEMTRQTDAPKTGPDFSKKTPAFKNKVEESEQNKKPDAYIPIKPGLKPAAPKADAPEKGPTTAVFSKTPPPPLPQADKKIRPPQIPMKTPHTGTPFKPVPEIQKQEGGGVAVQRAVPSTREVADLEHYMKSIQDEINTLMLRKGDLVSEIRQLLTKKTKPEAYGIYIVQSGDNIWDVHFDFLTEYFNGRDVELSRTADEPAAGGKSSGVGKILKFSENMVYIFNTRDRRLETDINMIHPLSKIVVFNMGQVFDLLDRLAFGDIEKIEFDGDNLWLPAES